MQVTGRDSCVTEQQHWWLKGFCCLSAAGALYVTMPLVKSRGKSTTYQNLRVPVQNFTGRDFQVSCQGNCCIGLLNGATWSCVHVVLCSVAPFCCHYVHDVY